MSKSFSTPTICEPSPLQLPTSLRRAHPPRGCVIQESVSRRQSCDSHHEPVFCQYL